MEKKNNDLLENMLFEKIEEISTTLQNILITIQNALENIAFFFGISIFIILIIEIICVYHFWNL